MKILVIEAGKQPRLADIDGSLKSMQETIGGYIQAIYPFDAPIALVCDEEGLFKDIKWNRRITQNCASRVSFSSADLPKRTSRTCPIR